MHAVVVEEGALRWAEVPDPVPREGELLLRVEATSVNRADLLQRQGHYPPPPGASDILGLEAAGTVLVGAGPYRPGDRVMAILTGGGYAERVAVDARHALPVPTAVGLPAAGGLMEVFLTAFYDLLELGGLVAGERCLIHGGAGGVGTAAVQLAREAGAEVWTTSRASKRERCLALGARHALDYARDDPTEALRAVGGAQLILDCLGAGALDANLRALAPDGRLVVIGLQQGRRGTLDLGRLLSRRLRVLGSTLRALPADRKAELVARFAERVVPLFAAGRLEVVVDRVLPLRDAERAHAVLEAGEHVGKVLLVP
ncbi:MAG: NAD(P)H-quinone oxidoreductase [Planctomycetota bacterium]|nr:MAG: NAD(P)H-quinone oxidoreductase [Planctomycetota bacterium]